MLRAKSAVSSTQGPAITNRGAPRPQRKLGQTQKRDEEIAQTEQQHDPAGEAGIEAHFSHLSARTRSQI